MYDLDLRIQPSSALSESRRSRIGLWARETTLGLDPAYVEARFDRYPLVATAWRDDELRAFLLFDEHESGGLKLTYLGPVFSRGGACVELFAAILGARLTLGSDFCVGMEFESDAAESTLRRLLPTTAFPTSPHGYVPLGVAKLAHAFATAFPHIEGLDDTRLQTRIRHPMILGTRRTHYQMMLVPCVGQHARRRLILQELEAGLASLRAYQKQTRALAASQ